MAVRVLKLPMADKKKMGRPGSGLDLASTKIDRQIVEQVAIVARDTKGSAAVILSDILRGPVAKLYRETLASMNKRLNATEKPPGA